MTGDQRAEIERLTLAVTKISQMSAQCGDDAVAMRKIATDAALWHKPDCMWWHMRDDGPPRAAKQVSDHQSAES